MTTIVTYPENDTTDPVAIRREPAGTIRPGVAQRSTSGRCPAPSARRSGAST